MKESASTRLPTGTKIATYLILGCGALLMVAPFLWMVSTSLKLPGAVFTYPPKWIPDPVMWSNYVKAWRAVPFNLFFLNSIFVAVCVTVGQVFTCSLAAYAFSRLEFWGRDKIFFAYLGTMMIPFPVTMIPVFILMTKLGWVDSLTALIVPGLFSAYGTFMLRQFFLSLPKDLEEAAIIDGASRWRIYWQIILPLSKPALATLATFVFMGTWNDFMWPLVIIKSVEKNTVPIGLASFQGLYTTDWTLLMAAAVIVLLPIVALYIFNQRFFIKGIAMTGFK